MKPSTVSARPALLLAALLGVVPLTGCESLRAATPAFLQPYRPDVQQGNVITREMADQLREGMTRDQVRFLLGTPLVTSAFHGDRWDYVYRLKRGKGNEVQTRQLTVLFKDNRLAKWNASELPDETMADNLILGRNPKAVPRPPQKAPDPSPSPSPLPSGG
jgi:outer membrane protein assembly factor BamE